MSELKTCRKCGSDELWITTGRSNIPDVKCNSCKNEEPMTSWNTRTESAEITQLKAQLAEAVELLEDLANNGIYPAINHFLNKQEP